MKSYLKAKPQIVAQVHQTLPDRTVVHWLTTITSPIEKYQDAQPILILKNLEQYTFLRTRCIEGRKGRAATTPPTIQGKLRHVYKG